MSTRHGPSLAETPGIGATTLGGFLEEVVDRFDSAEALVLADPLRDGEVVRWSYRRLGAAARSVAGGLVAAGVQPGDRVAVVMANRPEAVASIFGVALAGAVAAPMSTFAAPPELVDMVGRSGAVAVITQDHLRRRRFGTELTDLAGTGSTSVRQVVVVGRESWDELLEAGGPAGLDEPVRRSVVAEDDPALILFTSGTTSRPKAILHAHRSPTLQFWLQATVFGRGPDTRLFSALPIFWTAGLCTAMGATLAAGGCWVMQEVFEPASALRVMASERVTEPYTLPHQTAALAEHPDWWEADLSSLRCVYGKGAYARHPSVHGDPAWVMPVGYGLSETCTFVSGHRSDVGREQARIGSGRLLPGAQVRILDPVDGAELGTGIEGEIAVAGPTLMLGYLDGPVDRVDADGFLRTGDLGQVDDAGVLHYTGRLDEMIRTGGANVAPAEVEVELRRLHGVKLSRVLGVPDDRLGEVVVACIVRSGGATIEAEAVRGFLRERLAAYKVPRHVLFVDEGDMPMTDAGTKVRDATLRSLVLDRLADAGATATPAGNGGR